MEEINKNQIKNKQETNLKNDSEIELAIALEVEEIFYNQLMDSLEDEKRELFIKYSFIKDRIQRLKSALSWRWFIPR